MKVIGITGGIGTGKSSVSTLLRERGWTVYASDDTAKEIMDSDPEVRKRIAEALGQDVLTPAGDLDRKVMAERVFGETPEHRKRLEALNAIVHPLVLERHMDVLTQHAEEDTPIVAIESALLFEVGLEEGFDYVVVVDADPEECVRRVTSSRGLTPDQVRARMAEQMPMSEKRADADFVIENNGTHEALRKTVNAVATILETLP
jgi:dephospho-CoA kinase